VFGFLIIETVNIGLVFGFVLFFKKVDDELRQGCELI